MGCRNVKNDGEKTRNKVENIGVKSRSKSLKGGSGGNTVENESGKTSSHGEKRTKG